MFMGQSNYSFILKSDILGMTKKEFVQQFNFSFIWIL